MKISEYFVIGFVAFTALSFTALPHIEGRLFPVMGPLTLSNPEPAPPPAYRLRWNGEADKLRNCRPLRVDWYMGQRGGAFISIESEFADAPQIRFKGLLEWDSIYVSLDRANTLANSFANSVHQCPWRPWVTITPFYN